MTETKLTVLLEIPIEQYSARVASVVTSSLNNINKALVNAGAGTATVTGDAVVGQTLSCTFNKDDPEGAVVTKLSYQWLRDGVPILNAAAAAYVVQTADVTYNLSCRVVYTDRDGFRETIVSNALTARDVADPPPPPPPPPPVTGWPSEATTGPAAGVVLRDSGGFEVTTDGAVISGLRVTGSITVKARNVVVQDCEVDASGEIWGIGVPDEEGATDLKVTRCHIYGNGNPSLATRDASHVLAGVYGGVEVSFCNIHGCENAVCQGQANLYLHDNYFHNFANWPSVHDDHTDGLQTWGWAGSGGLRVVHNTILSWEDQGEKAAHPNGGSSAIALSQNQHDILIDNNLLAGGSATIYGNAQAGGSPVNTVVTNNHFSTMYYPTCGTYMTHTGFAKGASGFVWTGNVWHETGLPVLA